MYMRDIYYKIQYFVDLIFTREGRSAACYYISFVILYCLISEILIDTT